MRRDMNTGVRRLGRVVAGLWPGTLSVCAISGNPRASVSSFTMETVRDRPPKWETEKGLKGHLVSGVRSPRTGCLSPPVHPLALGSGPSPRSGGVALVPPLQQVGRRQLTMTLSEGPQGC